MKLNLLLALSTTAVIFGLAVPVSRGADNKESRFYEMRIYYASPKKLDDLHARFRDHTCKLFEKHGMTNIGYWVPIDNKHNMLVYLLAYPSPQVRQKSWKAFLTDPAWINAYKESEKDGTLVAKIETMFLRPTDYSPAIKPAKKVDRIFELRTYTASKGNLDNLNARFRNHTCKLFEKHGMTNLCYFVKPKNEKHADTALIYFLAHKSVDAAKASFDGFRKDPAWQSALKNSEKKAGGPLTAKNGVKSLFLKATDYSPIR